MNKELVSEAVTLAQEARKRAHAPYVGFRTGAAVATDKGALVPGALVENASPGLAMCAERVALFATVAQNAGRPTLLVVVSERTNGQIAFPCGGCLQVALELGGPELQVVACDLDGGREARSLAELAPQLPRRSASAGES